MEDELAKLENISKEKDNVMDGLKSNIHTAEEEIKQITAAKVSD